MDLDPLDGTKSNFCTERGANFAAVHIIPGHGVARIWKYCIVVPYFGRALSGAAVYYPIITWSYIARGFKE